MFPNWLQSGLPRQVFAEKYLKISFSQNGEDDFIRGHFWSEILAGYKGTYLDIGCFSETLYSNTKLLSLIGWHGIAVDANPELLNPWLTARAQDHFFNLCISPSGSSPEGLEFFRFKDGAMSTANPVRAQELVNKGWEMLDKVRVPSLSLQALASKAKNEGLINPDLISIDIEMVDFLPDLPEFLSILKSRLLCMECVSGDVSLRNLFNSKEAKKLTEAAYEPVNFIGGNIFAVPKYSLNEIIVFG